MRTNVLRAVRTKLLDTRQTFPAMEPRALVRAAPDPDADLPGNGYYRRMAARESGTRRDPAAGLLDAQRSRSIELATVNPLIARYLSFMLDWIRPRSFSPHAIDPRVDEVVQEFWGDPRNDWQEFLGPLMRAKMTTGEVAIPVIVDPDGRVSVDYIDPADISAVIFATGSNRRRAEIALASRDTAGPSRTQKHPIVRADPRSGMLMGRDPRVMLTPDAHGIHGVLFFAYGCLPNAARGVGDYYASLDYLAILDDLHHAFAERAQMLARVVGDLSVEGPDIEGIRQEVAQLAGYGSVYVHTDSVKATLGAPSMGSSEAKEQERMVRVYGASTTGVPPHILSGDFTEGNRAIALGTEDPAYMRGAAQQDDLALVVETACRFAVDQVRLLRPARLAGVEDFEIVVERPKLLKPDPRMAGEALAAISEATALMVQRGQIDEDTARQICVRAVNDVGVADVYLEEIESKITPPPAEVAPE